MSYTEIINQVSSETGIPPEVVSIAYRHAYKFILEKISGLPLTEDLSEEQFRALRCNFNLPSLGKLNCTYSRYAHLKNKYHNITKNKKEEYGDKED